MNEAILLVDDEPHVLKALKRSLLEEGYEIFTAEGGEEALALAQRQPFKVVISDERMPGMAGSEFLELMALRYPQTVRILLTGHASVDAALHAVNQGNIYRFLVKPWDNLQLLMAVRSAVEKHDLEMENRRLLALVRTQGKKLLELTDEGPKNNGSNQQPGGSYRIDEMGDDEIRQVLSSLDMPS